MPDALRALDAWSNFYVIVGSSGAALIGLQFVVMALIADLQPKNSPDAIGAFGTPTVVHFAGALIIAALMSVPWPAAAAPMIALGAYGFGGVVYGAIVVARARRQTAYAPVWQDWLWHAILPSASYALLAVGAMAFDAWPLGLFVIGGSALALLLIGIHNAWDTVTHLIATAKPRRRKEGR
jgi:hypothetical protein